MATVNTIPLLGTSNTIVFNPDLETPAKYRLQSKYIAYGVLPYGGVTPVSTTREAIQHLRASAFALFDEQLRSNGQLGVVLTQKFASLSSRYIEHSVSRFVLQDGQHAAQDALAANPETIAWARTAFAAETMSRFYGIADRLHDPFMMQWFEQRGLSSGSSRAARALYETPASRWIKYDASNVDAILQPSTDAYMPLMAQGGGTQKHLFRAMRHMGLFVTRSDDTYVHTWTTKDLPADPSQEAYNAVWAYITGVFDAAQFEKFLVGPHADLKARLMTTHTREQLMTMKLYVRNNMNKYQRERWVYADADTLPILGRNAFNDVSTHNKDSHFWVSPHQEEFRNNIKAWMCSEKMVYYFSMRRMQTFVIDKDDENDLPKQQQNDTPQHYRCRVLLYQVLRETFKYRRLVPGTQAPQRHTSVKNFHKVFDPVKLKLRVANIIDNAYYFCKWALIARSVFTGTGVLTDKWMDAMDKVVDNPEPDEATTTAMKAHIPDWTHTMHLNIRSFITNVLAFRQKWLEECDKRDTSYVDFNEVTLTRLRGIFYELRTEWKAILQQNEMTQRAQRLAPVSYVEKPVAQIPMPLAQTISHIDLTDPQKAFLSCIRGVNAQARQKQLQLLCVPAVKPPGNTFQHQVVLAQLPPYNHLTTPRVPTVHEYLTHLTENDRILQYDLNRNYASEVDVLPGFHKDGDTLHEYAAVQLRALPGDADTARGLRVPGNLVPRMGLYGAYAAHDCFRYDYSYNGHDEVYPPCEYGMVITNPRMAPAASKKHQSHKLIVLWEDIELPFNTPNLSLQTILDRFVPQLKGPAEQRKAWVWYLGPGEQLFVNRPGLARWELTYVNVAAGVKAPYKGTIEYFMNVDTLPRHFNYWHVPLAREAGTWSSSIETRIPWLTRRDNLLDMYDYILRYHTNRVEWLVQHMPPVRDGWWGATATRLFLDYCTTPEPKPPHLKQRLQSSLYWTYIDRSSTSWRDVRVTMNRRQRWFGDDVDIKTLKGMRNAIPGDNDNDEGELRLANDSHMVSRLEAFYALFEKDDTLSTDEDYVFKIREAAMPGNNDMYHFRIRGVNISNAQAPPGINSLVGGTDWAASEYLFDPNVGVPEDDHGEFTVAPPFSTLNTDMYNYRGVYRRALCGIDFEVQLVLYSEDGDGERWGMRRWVYYTPHVLLEPTNASQCFVQEGHEVPPSDQAQYVSYRSDNDVRISKPADRSGEGWWRGVFEVIYNRVEDSLLAANRPVVHRNPFLLNRAQQMKEFLANVLQEHNKTKEEFDKMPGDERMRLQNKAEYLQSVEEEAKRAMRTGLVPVGTKGAKRYARNVNDDVDLKPLSELTEEELKALDDAEDEEVEEDLQDENLTFVVGTAVQKDVVKMRKVNREREEQEDTNVTMRHDGDAMNEHRFGDDDLAPVADDEEMQQDGAEQDDAMEDMVGGMGTLRVY